MWDPSPRFTSMPTMYTPENNPSLWKLTPNSFRRHLRVMLDLVKDLPDDSYAKRLFMLDNWNEWDEGNYIMPSHEFGYGYLQAVREELTARDNLPDYRTPQDLGLSEELNREWAAPDLRDVCRKNLGEK
jgi:hypothetical protein